MDVQQGGNKALLEKARKSGYIQIKLKEYIKKV